MKKTFALLVVFIVLLTCSLFAAYEVGDVVDDFSWTDNTGTSHSIYELVNTEKAVLFFWGGDG